MRHGMLLPSLVLSACSGPGDPDDTVTLADVDATLGYAAQQVRKAELRLDVVAQPAYTPTNRAGGQWDTADASDWRSGFFTGTEWLLYEALGDEDWQARAAARTDVFADEVSRPQTHDVGFKTLTTYGDGFRLTHRADYLPKIFAGANTLAARFVP